jgi:hypothetical protein
MIIDQRRKAIFQPIPHLPDKGAVMKKTAMLGKKAIPQPEFQILPAIPYICQQPLLDFGGPILAISRG